MAHVINLDEKVFTKLKKHCLSVFDTGKLKTVDSLMIEMMDYDEVPIHYPYHHFIIPAALMTLTSMQEKVSREELEEMLEEVENRSKNVLGGFCGNYGACGAAVGAGIFLSIYTDTSPMSGKSWQWCNELTGKCLMSVSKVAGPRCCKRTGFLSVIEAVPYINQKLNVNLEVSKNILCKYYEKNNECKKTECPFYPNK